MAIDDAWTRVHAEARRLKPIHLRTLFDRDPGQFGRLSRQLDDLTLDLSKEKLDDAALAALLALARATDIEVLRDRMFAGEDVNPTEGRAALHMALRGGAPAPAGDDVAGVLERFLNYADAVRDGPIRDVVNIGIGGSDLGPAMTVRALAPDHDGPRLHFVSNVDGAHLGDTLRGLDPATTLAVVCSKTFATLETMTNARAMRAWLGGHAAANIAAVSANTAACAEFGIPAQRVFGFWDWVGGRYSIWGAVGLSLAIAVGPKSFRAFLAGAATMDRHFRKAPLDRNLPILLGLAGIWRRSAMGWPTVALIPYDQRLARLPAYVQQLDMESNGKGIRTSGDTVTSASGPVIWGEPGTNAQHSFFQLLHQGTDVVPVDFILAARPRDADPEQHALLVANCLAQGQALAFGRTEDEARAAGAGELAAYRTFPGDRPSTTILHRQLDAFALGRLIALYEHKVFTMAAIWGINPFDQFGVELGKALAGRLIPAVRGGSSAGLDSSTAGLIARIRETDQ